MCLFQRLRPWWLPLLSVLSLLTVCIVLLVTLRSGPPPPLPYSAPPDGMHTASTARVIYNIDPVEVGKTLVIQRAATMWDDDKALIKLTEDCPLFIWVRGYHCACVSQEERLPPGLLSGGAQVAVDGGETASTTTLQQQVLNSVRRGHGGFGMLPIVFISSKLESVYYAGISRLKTDLNCMHDLLASEAKWRYIINLCGQDFPLRSNAELVSELRKLNGANSLQTVQPLHQMKQRFGFHHELREPQF